MAADRRILAAKLAVSIVLLGYIVSRSDLEAVGNVFRGLALWMLLPIVALYFLNTLISAWKWSLLLGADGFTIPLPSLVRSYLIGTFFNIFLPSSIGGDAYRIYDISRQSSRTAGSLASVFADRLTGFLALSAWGLVFSLAGLSLLPEKSVVFIPLSCFLVLLLAVTVLFLWGRRAIAFFRLDRFQKAARFAGRMLDSVDAYRGNAGVLRAAAALSLLFQFLVIVLVFMMGRMLGLQAPFLVYCMFVPLITLLEALPISIYGMGVRDLSYVFFFSQAGVPREEALSLSLVFLAISIFYAFAFGGTAFLTRGTGGILPQGEGSP